MKKQSNARQDAYNRAINQGQQAWHDGKDESENPYPHNSANHDAWAKGWQQECDLETW
ncbi:ribosome modulation factor [Brucella pseudogrignonensis]|uniref:ribosome modulation factor n=1 Tax=Brucella pseudogrignonensis TaxID=419475 RepID=UPI003ED07E56